MPHKLRSKLTSVLSPALIIWYTVQNLGQTQKLHFLTLDFEQAAEKSHSRLESDTWPTAVTNLNQQFLLDRHHANAIGWLTLSWMPKKITPCLNNYNIYKADPFS